MCIHTYSTVLIFVIALVNSYVGGAAAQHSKPLKASGMGWRIQAE